MKTIIAGSRGITSFKIVEAAVDAAPFKISEVVSGCARGVDTLAIQWAAQYGVSVKRFPVLAYEWEKWGKYAGPRRNARMADYAEAMIAVWDGKSRGTADMVRQAREKGLAVSVFTVGSAQGMI